MAGSGLSNVLETVYGKNAVEDMMTGNMILLKELIPVMQDNQHDEIVSDNDDLVLSRLWTLYSDIVDKRLSVDEVVEEEYIIELGTLLRQLKSKLTISYKTAKLWLLYCEYVQVVKLFIRAQVIGTYISIQLARCSIYSQPLDICIMQKVPAYICR